MFFKICSSVLFTFSSQVLAQEKPEGEAAADSAGFFGQAITDLAAHTPRIEWYMVLLDLIWIILIMLMGYIISRYVMQPLRVLASRGRKYSAVLTRFVFTCQIIIWPVVLYLILFKVIRVSQITEAIIGTTIGLAILIAARDLLTNLMAGIRITLTKMIKTGDWIRLPEMDGVIEKIGLIATTCRHGDNHAGLIPNRMFLQKPIIELISANTFTPVVVNFYFPAEANFVKIREIVERAASLSKFIYLNKPVTIKLENILKEGRSLVLLQLDAYIINFSLESAFRSEISEQVLGEIFRQKLISADQMII